VRQHEIHDKSKLAVFDRPNLFISHAIRTEGRERTRELSMANGSTRQIRAGRSCHSYVINCPVEFGRDSNWIDYRYASRRTVAVMAVAVMVRYKRFIRFPAWIGPESRRRDWKISHGR